MGNEAYRYVSVGEIDGLLGVVNRQQTPAGFGLEPLEGTTASAVAEADDILAASSQNDDMTIAHRWTLEELWGFVIRLDRLEERLGRTETAAPALPLDDQPTETPALELVIETTEAAETIEATEATEAVEMARTTPTEALTDKKAILKEREAEELLFAEQAKGRSISKPARIKAEHSKPRGKGLSKLAICMVIIGALALIALGIYRLTS